MRKRQIIVLATAFVMVFSMVFTNASAVYGVSVNDAMKIEFNKQYSAEWTADNATDQHCVQIDVASAGIVRISASKPVDTDGYMKLNILLYNDADELVWGSECTYTVDDASTVYNFSVGLLPGTYYLKMKPGSQFATDKISTDYAVSFSADLYSEREPNAVKADATLMGLGKEYTGFFGSDGAYNADGSDIYQFNFIKGYTYRITVEDYDAIKETSTMIDFIDANGYDQFINWELEDRGYFSYTASMTGAHYLQLRNYNSAQYSYTVKVDQTNPSGLANMLRIGGNDRYDTAIIIADQLKNEKQIRKFDNIIVASGLNYPDALSGGYLAKVKNASILLVGTDTVSEKKVADYIHNNMKSGGTVYILGGTGVVTQRFQNSLYGCKVSRLSGTNRYGTNMTILEATNAKNTDLLICTGNGYADSLSASAVGLPIMMVSGDNINEQQKNFIEKMNPENIYIIGGDGVVSRAMMQNLGVYSKVERVSGANRYATSVEVAKKFFSEESANIVLAYAHNYPDGLSGGPLAMSMGSPLVLTDNVNPSYADKYASSAGVDFAVVFGGTTLISDNTIKNILSY